jgi:hypothetical protein
MNRNQIRATDGPITRSPDDDDHDPQADGGNNPFLAKVKRAMNAPIFREASRLANAEGEAAARAYVQRFFTSPVDAGLDNILAAIGRPR